MASFCWTKILFPSPNLLGGFLKPTDCVLIEGVYLKFVNSIGAPNKPPTAGGGLPSPESLKPWCLEALTWCLWKILNTSGHSRESEFSTSHPHQDSSALLSFPRQAQTLSRIRRQPLGFWGSPEMELVREGSEPNLAAGCAHPQQLRTTSPTLRFSEEPLQGGSDQICRGSGTWGTTGLSFPRYLILPCLLVGKVCTACLYFRTRMKRAH